MSSVFYNLIKKRLWPLFLKHLKLLVLTLLFLLVLVKSSFWSQKEEAPLAKKCFQEKEETVQGVSMEPLIHNGDTVLALIGFYNCHQIVREDVVLVDYPGSPHNFIIKRVRAIPGDTLALIKTDDYWNININGIKLLNSAGEAYTLTDEQSLHLRNDERGYGGIIPSKYYLVLGEIPSGSMDSTKSGLFVQDMIVAKVILK